MPAMATAHTARDILRRVLAGRTTAVVNNVGSVIIIMRCGIPAYDSQRVLFLTDSEDWGVCRGLWWVMTYEVSRNEERRAFHSHYFQFFNTHVMFTGLVRCLLYIYYLTLMICPSDRTSGNGFSH